MDEVGYKVISESPKTVIWLVTSKCNLSCRHCYALPYRTEKDLGLNDILKLIDEASSIGVEHIHYTGGEPLMRDDIFDILNYTIAKGIEASIFTNATLINDYIARRLSDLDIAIYTSIDGHNKQVYESVRGSGTWVRFLRGIKLLNEYGLYIHMNISVNELNWRYVGDIVRKALELNASSISLIPSMPAGNALRNNVYIRPAHFEYAIKVAADVARELGIAISIWCTPFVPIITRSPYLSYRSCRDWDVLDISPSGRVLICDVLNIDVGNVVKLGIKGAWRVLKRNQLVKRIENPKLQEPCRSCQLRYFCKGGCYARAYLVLNNIEAPDPLCPRVHRFLLSMRVKKVLGSGT
ncbi:MAG: hypothetical protein DRO18_01760 [Thermoprotei archaeon]|nr:MAG: hypothetical protein DRO18_01760 [Thermoprotei archaeon]